jgi:HEXXH motif-containing protein
MTMTVMPLALWAVAPDARQDLQTEVRQRLLGQADEVVRASLQGLVGDAHQGLPELLQATRAVDVLKAADADTQDRVVQHPAFRYWLQGMRRSSGEANAGQFEEFVRHASDFGWIVEMISGGSTKPWTVWTDDRGGLRCAGAGRYIELGEAYRDQWVQVSGARSITTVACQDGLVVRIPTDDLVAAAIDHPPSIDKHGYEMRVFPIVAGTRTEVTSRDPWLRVHYTGTNQRTDGTEFFGAAEDIYPSDFDLSQITAACEQLGRYWPDGLLGLAEFTRAIVPISSPPNTFRAFTVSSRQGAVYVGPAPATDTVEMLLHECAHIKLRQIQLIDPLLVDPLDETFRVRVPWRPDPRPLPGILEGIYVFSHVAQYRLLRLEADCSENPDRVRSLLADLEFAADVLAREARLTEAGRDFIDAMGRWIASIEAAA